MDGSVFRRRLRIVLILTITAAAALGALQSAAMLLDYEDAVQLYYSGRVLPTVIRVLLLSLSVLTVPVCALLGKDSASLRKMPPPSGPTAFAAAAGGALIIASGILAVPTLVSGMQALGYKSLFSVLRIVTAVPGGLYLLMIGGRAAENSFRSVLTGSCLLINVMMCIFTRYFVMDGPINSPPLVLGRLSQMAVLLSLTYGLRFDCGMAKTRCWCAVSVWAVLFGGASCVSEIARVIAGRVPFGADTVGVLARTAVVLYIIFRLADCTRGPSPAPSPAPEKEETTHE